MKAVPQRCLGNRPNETNQRPFEKGETKHTLTLITVLLFRESLPSLQRCNFVCMYDCIHPVLLSLHIMGSLNVLRGVRRFTNLTLYLLHAGFARPTMLNIILLVYYVVGCSVMWGIFVVRFNAHLSLPLVVLQFTVYSPNKWDAN